MLPSFILALISASLRKGMCENLAMVQHNNLPGII